jgi:hypothetical protein
MSVEYLLKQYGLQQGALEIQYIEEFFLDFPRKKTAAEVIQRLVEPRPSDPDGRGAAAGRPVHGRPRVSFKVSHELRAVGDRPEAGGPGRPARGLRGVRRPPHPVPVDRRDAAATGAARGTFAPSPRSRKSGRWRTGSTRFVVKTKNRFYEMRSTLAQLQFDVIRFVPHPVDSGESKVFLRKRLGQHVLDTHRSRRSVVRSN